MRNDCLEGRILNISREFNRNDCMVESQVRWRLWRHRTAFSFDDNVVGVDANLAQHRSKQCSFVLTITIPVGKDLCRSVRLPASDSEFNSYISNIMLHELGQSLDLVNLCRCSGSQDGNLLPDFR